MNGLQCMLVDGTIFIQGACLKCISAASTHVLFADFLQPNVSTHKKFLKMRLVFLIMRRFIILET